MGWSTLGGPSQAQQIIFEMQTQRSSQKEQQKKYIFLNYKTRFFHFSSF
jgi:hypothetical protein